MNKTVREVAVDISLGVTEEDIKENLVEEGWTEAQIAVILQKAKSLKVDHAC